MAEMESIMMKKISDLTVADRELILISMEEHIFYGVPDVLSVKAKLTIIRGLNDTAHEIHELTDSSLAPTIKGEFFEALIHLPVTGLLPASIDDSDPLRVDLSCNRALQ